MLHFRECLNKCQVEDLGYDGNIFTWSNGRDEHDFVECRLDRAAASEEWKTLFPFFKIKHLPRYKSDHNPILIEAYNTPKAQTEVSKRKKFRFEQMWCREEQFKEVMREAWGETKWKEDISGKIERCGEILQSWAYWNFGSIKKRKKELTDRLEELEAKNFTDEIKTEKKAVEAELDEVLAREETMWFQRSRALWLKEGDKNTKFFHSKASHRRSRNCIRRLEVDNGRVIQNKEEIAKELTSFFKNLFTAEETEVDQEVWDALKCKVTPEINKQLMEPFTSDEVVTALRQMHPSKAPGPDGMPPYFFQKFWHLCGKDVSKDILNILNNEGDPTYINQSHIILIPKVRNPTNPRDLRPISLANVVARIVSKTIANRLKKFLPSIISESQSAFIPGRIITDNAMTAFEIFHYIKNKTKGKKGWVALKLDMSKAYDRVEWNFLEIVMLKLGFDKSWVSLIMRIVRSVSYNLCVNDFISESFNPERGLR